MSIWRLKSAGCCRGIRTVERPGGIVPRSSCYWRTDAQRWTWPPTATKRSEFGCVREAERVAHDDQRSQLVALQYETVRQESNQARQDMHSILGWNQALIVALFGAGLVIVASGKHAGVAELAFGLVLPVLLIGGALAWAGEMIRMERTGAFLRALERSTWSRSADGSAVAT